MKKILLFLSILYGTAGFAQSPCDSLDITVKYYPFYDSIIQIDVINHSQTFFNYPVFKIYDQTQDSVAVETLNLFGIAQSSSHILDVNPNNVPQPVFNGQLVLYYADSALQTCSYQMNFNLCLDTCKKVYPYLGNFGSATVYGTANWDIRNSNQQVVATGTFTLDTSSQYVSDSACLPKGEYTLHVSQGTLSQGGQCQMGIYTSGMGPYPHVPFNDTAVNMPFTMYEACPPVVTRVNEVLPSSAPATVYSHGATVYIRSTAANGIGHVAVYTMDGKVIYSHELTTLTHQVDLSAYPAGVYMVRIISDGNVMGKKVFITE